MTTPAMTVELLQCPFCGGHDERSLTKGGALLPINCTPLLEELQDETWRVMCYCCLASVVADTPKYATQKWNTRVAAGNGGATTTPAMTTEQAFDILYALATYSPDFARHTNADAALEQLRTQGAAPQAIYQALLKVHHGDARAAARQLIQHIRAEQEALLMLIDNGPSDH